MLLVTRLEGVEAEGLAFFSGAASLLLVLRFGMLRLLVIWKHCQGRLEAVLVAPRQDKEVPLGDDRKELVMCRIRNKGGVFGWLALHLQVSCRALVRS